MFIMGLPSRWPLINEPRMPPIPRRVNNGPNSVFWREKRSDSSTIEGPLFD